VGASEEGLSGMVIVVQKKDIVGILIRRHPDDKSFGTAPL
jgi:hypothetical protein